MSTTTAKPDSTEVDGGADTGEIRRPWLVLIIVLSAAFMELVDVSIVNVAIPSIQRELETSYASIEFIVAGCQPGFACVIVTAARLGDIYGRKRLFLIGMAAFTMASLASGGRLPRCPVPSYRSPLHRSGRASTGPAPQW